MCLKQFNMKTLLFISVFMGYIFAGIAQVGIGTTDPKAILDIVATNVATPTNVDGILIPRIDDFPVTLPSIDQDGMMVFATGNGIPIKGFYYWNNTTTTWISVGGAVDTQNTLGQAYNEGGSGVGRTITADNGAVLINGTDGFQNTGNHNTGAVLSLTGAGTKLFFYPRKSAFRAGRTTATQWDDASIGEYSTSLGLNNIASSYGGTSFGVNNTASATNASTAFGSNNTASGNYATAFGFSSMATADYATAFGDGAEASGQNSTAFGDGTEASGQGSSAYGNNSTASGDYATAFGFISEATGNYATAFGNRTDATANYATAFGSFSIASADTATAFGSSSTASGATSTAFGSGSTASGANSTAFGTSIASGVYAISFGRSVEARSYAELAVGVYNNLSTPVNPNSFNASDKIFSIGNGLNAANRSNALTIYKDGRMNINDAYTMPTADGTANQVLTTDGLGAVTFQTVTGDGDTQNTLDGAYDEGGPGAGRTITASNGAVLINGNDGFQNTGTFGSGATLALTGAETKMFFYPRKAAFRAGYVNGNQWNDANIGNYSTAFGNNNTASGTRSVAFGNNNTVNGQGAAAFGSTNNLDGFQSFAFGSSNDLSGDNGAAFGEGNNASGYSNLLAGISNTSSGESSIAMGQGNEVAGDISLAFGNSNTVNSSNSVAIGTNLEAFSAYETVVGINSTNYSPASTIAFNANDRLFAIGNGTSTAARSNALTIYKDGRMIINDAYTMPTTDGTANQVLTTDGSGTASWQDTTTPFELKDPKYPDGFSGMTPITMNNLSTTSYTVPAGKNVYITNVISSTGATTLSISGTVVLSGIHNVGNNESLTNPLIAGSGNSITASTNSLGISGFLINANIIPITIPFTPSYIVPANKVLVILNARGGTNFSIDSITIYNGNGNSQTTAGLTSFHNPIFLDEGQALAVNSGAINGYLIDK